MARGATKLKDIKVSVHRHERSCGDCNACCEGYLNTRIHGYVVFPGCACHFLDKENKKCGIYESRPENPCRIYKCVWLADVDRFFPEWMKPNVSGVIISEKPWGENLDKKYWAVQETFKPIESNILYWIIAHSEQIGMPLAIKIHGKMHLRGPKEFHDFIHKGAHLNEPV